MISDMEGPIFSTSARERYRKVFGFSMYYLLSRLGSMIIHRYSPSRSMDHSRDIIPPESKADNRRLSQSVEKTKELRWRRKNEGDRRSRKGRRLRSRSVG